MSWTCNYCGAPMQLRPAFGSWVLICPNQYALPTAHPTLKIITSNGTVAK